MMVILAMGRGGEVEKGRGRRWWAKGGRGFGVQWEREERGEGKGRGRRKRKDILEGWSGEMGGICGRMSLQALDGDPICTEYACGFLD